ncbi:hypothetical protein B0H11DRAFT_2236086 [Mycena galericulata]|nr:hypothetical protein B0H11DRAFT_2257157 [Mycena galericulata]KAJ7474390.1 hypothetical protein B0H11DRAFT_2236086 [Mycena galericulata]
MYIDVTSSCQEDFNSLRALHDLDWFVAGNEIAHHTITHVGDLPNNEISGNLIALNSVAGIPLASIHGFCAPYLNYSIKTAKLLHAALGHQIRIS